MGEISGFIFLKSYYTALRPLPDTERLILYDRVLDYVFAGEETEDLPPLLNAVFQLIRPNIEASLRRYATSVENGKKGGRPPKNPGKTQQEPAQNLNETQSKPGENLDKDKESEKDKESDLDIVQADKPPAKSKRFQPPSITEVREYCTERQNTVDPEQFVDFYQSRGWRSGKTQLKDWRACVRTWERKANEGGEKFAGTENNFGRDVAKLSSVSDGWFD